MCKREKEVLLLRMEWAAGGGEDRSVCDKANYLETLTDWGGAIGGEEGRGRKWEDGRVGWRKEAENLLLSLLKNDFLTLETTSYDFKLCG